VIRAFADEEQIAALERQMAERAVLKPPMANSFNLMRRTT
jgi:hypothetical protein